MSPNRLLLTPEKSLTMKLYRSPTNNSDGIFPVSFSVQPPFILRSTSVRAPFNLRSSSVQPPFELRSTSVRAPFELRSTSVRAPFNLRSSSVHLPFELRSAIEDQSKYDRRTNGESSEARRRCIETLMRNQGKGDLTKIQVIMAKFSENLTEVCQCLPVNFSKVASLQTSCICNL